MPTAGAFNGNGAKETNEESKKKKAQREGKRRRCSIRTNGTTVTQGEGGFLKFK